jgi:hypothetical protein
MAFVIVGVLACAVLCLRILAPARPGAAPLAPSA